MTLAGVVGWALIIVVAQVPATLASILIGVPAVIALAACFIPLFGRKAVNWIPIMARFVKRRVTKQDRYIRRLLTPRPAGTLALPGDVAPLRQYIEPSTRAPLIHDPHEKTLTVVARVDYEQILLESEAEQERRSHAWGTALSTMGGLEGVVRIQTLERTLPDSGVGVESFWNNWPNKPPKDAWVRRQYEALLADSSTIAERHESLLAVTISLTKAGAAVKDAGGGLLGGGQVMVSVMRSVEHAMRGAHLSVQWLTERELAVIIQSAYEPSRAVELEREDLVAPKLATAGPIGTEETWTHYRIDTDWAQVWEATQMPRIPQKVGFLRPLVFTPGVNATVSMIYEPVDTGQALAAADREVGKEESARQDRIRMGKVDTIVNHREREEASQHLDDIASGYGTFNYALLVAISAPDERALGVASATVRAAARDMLLDLRIAAGQQAALFPAAALPLGRRP